MLSLNGSTELARLRPPASQRPQQPQQPSAADRVLQATQRAVEAALGAPRPAGQPDSADALRDRWAAAWKEEDTVGDLRASQASTAMDEFYLVPDSAAAQLKAAGDPDGATRSGHMPDKLLLRPQPQAPRVVTDVVDVRATTFVDGASGELAPDEGIATMTRTGAGGGDTLRQGALYESPAQRFVGDEGDIREGESADEATAAAAAVAVSATPNELADCRRKLGSRKVGGGGISGNGGTGGRIVHPRVLPAQQQQQQLAATAAASAALAMAEPLIRGQQQVEANIARLLDRLDRLETGRTAGGQQHQQLEERRLREQLDRLLADRLGQMEHMQFSL